MEKDHHEIILGNIQSKFQLVLEGHESLRKEIRGAREGSNEKHEHTAFLIDGIIKRLDPVAAELASHRADTEGHRKSYRVGEGSE